MFLVFMLALALAAAHTDTATGKFLRSKLIETPSRWLSALTLTKVVFLILIPAAIVAFLVFEPSDAARVAALSLPEGMVWFLAFDISSYVDVLLVVWILAASGGLRVAYRAVAAAVTGAGSALVAAARLLASRNHAQGDGRRAPRRPRQRGGPSQDEDARGWGVAALGFA